ncbi:MAG: phenylalanine--tRNA ligase subunit beta, partial [Oscillospiraceae bacterium]|nr:phenylalanine--tRNA ligase subunit beta [Oscillospiraceae bacterium]
VARFYGYNDIPTTLMRGATTRGGYSPSQKLENQAGAAARAMGYSEIITYSFVSPAGMDMIRAPKDDPRRNQIKLLNPLGEDSSVMRTTGIPSMLDILSRNYAYHNKSARLYELAKIYLPVAGEDLPREPKLLMLGSYGPEEDFYSLKGAVEGILSQLNVLPVSFEAVTDNPSFHPGRCAALIIEGKRIGLLGQIHPLAARNYGMDCEVYCAELNFTELLSVLAPEKTFTALPRFPATSRDLAVVCDEAVSVGALEACITGAAGKLLREIKLFDVYRGTGIQPGKKSVAFSLTFRAEDRTLTDADIEPAMDKIVKTLEASLNAVRR